MAKARKKAMSEAEWLKIRLDLEQSPKRSNKSKIAAWASYGYPSPPPSAYKQELVKAYARAYKLSILVETGTYFGEMVEACLDDFEQIYSVELSQELYEKAQEKFQDYKKVQLYQGDSAKVLGKILKKVKRPALFWLDAHFSGGVTAKSDTNTPLLDELTQVLKSRRRKNHLLLIDDARCFVGQDDYPPISQIQALVSSYWPEAHLVSRRDIIRIQPDEQHIEI